MVKKKNPCTHREIKVTAFKDDQPTRETRKKRREKDSERS